MREIWVSLEEIRIQLRVGEVIGFYINFSACLKFRFWLISVR